MTEEEAAYEQMFETLSRHVEAGLQEVLGDVPGDCPPDEQGRLDALLEDLAQWTARHRQRNLHLAADST